LGTHFQQIWRVALARMLVTNDMPYAYLTTMQDAVAWNFTILSQLLTLATFARQCATTPRNINSKIGEKN